MSQEILNNLVRTNKQLAQTIQTLSVKVQSNEHLITLLAQATPLEDLRKIQRTLKTWTEDPEVDTLNHQAFQHSLAIVEACISSSSTDPDEPFHALQGDKD